MTNEVRESRWRGYLGLLLALGLDNFGSGLFLPLTMVYATRVIGLSVEAAGAALSVGTLAGLLVPVITGRLVERVGPRTIVVSSQLIQFGGMFVYFLADGFVAAVAAAVLVAAGTQMFYSALVALVADVSPEGPKDRPLALVSMVRSGAFGLGALVAGLLITRSEHIGLRAAVLVNALTFVVAAALLVLLLSPSAGSGAPHAEKASAFTVLRNGRFLMLIVMNALIALAGDFFLVGFSVFVLEILVAPEWTVGVCFALLTTITSLGGTTAVRLTARFRRTSTMAVGAGLLLVWCLACAGLTLRAQAHPSVWLILLTLVFALGCLLCDSRSSAMAEATAPLELKGRYLAAFQYSYTAASLTAPLLVGLFTLDARAPWLVVAGALVASISMLFWLGARLPHEAVYMQSPVPTPAAGE